MLLANRGSKDVASDTNGNTTFTFPERFTRKKILAVEVDVEGVIRYFEVKR